MDNQASVLQVTELKVLKEKIIKIDTIFKLVSEKQNKIDELETKLKKVHIENTLLRNKNKELISIHSKLDKEKEIIEDNFNSKMLEQSQKYQELENHIEQLKVMKQKAINQSKQSLSKYKKFLLKKKHKQHHLIKQKYSKQIQGLQITVKILKRKLRVYGNQANNTESSMAKKKINILQNIVLKPMPEKKDSVDIFLMLDEMINLPHMLSPYPAEVITKNAETQTVRSTVTRPVQTATLNTSTKETQIFLKVTSSTTQCNFDANEDNQLNISNTENLKEINSTMTSSVQTDGICDLQKLHLFDKMRTSFTQTCDNIEATKKGALKVLKNISSKCQYVQTADIDLEDDVAKRKALLQLQGKKITLKQAVATLKRSRKSFTISNGILVHYSKGPISAQVSNEALIVKNIFNRVIKYINDKGLDKNSSRHKSILRKIKHLERNRDLRLRSNRYSHSSDSDSFKYERRARYVEDLLMGAHTVSGDSGILSEVESGKHPSYQSEYNELDVSNIFNEMLVDKIVTPIIPTSAVEDIEMECRKGACKPSVDAIVEMEPKIKSRKRPINRMTMLKKGIRKCNQIAIRKIDNKEDNLAVLPQKRRQVLHVSHVERNQQNENTKATALVNLDHSYIDNKNKRKKAYDNVTFSSEVDNQQLIEHMSANEKYEEFDSMYSLDIGENVILAADNCESLNFIENLVVTESKSKIIIEPNITQPVMMNEMTTRSGKTLKLEVSAKKKRGRPRKILPNNDESSPVPDDTAENLCTTRSGRVFKRPVRFVHHSFPLSEPKTLNTSPENGMKTKKRNLSSIPESTEETKHNLTMELSSNEILECSKTTKGPSPKFAENCASLSPKSALKIDKSVANAEFQRMKQRCLNPKPIKIENSPPGNSCNHVLPLPLPSIAKKLVVSTAVTDSSKSCIVSGDSPKPLETSIFDMLPMMNFYTTSPEQTVGERVHSCEDRTTRSGKSYSPRKAPTTSTPAESLSETNNASNQIMKEANSSITSTQKNVTQCKILHPTRESFASDISHVNEVENFPLLSTSLKTSTDTIRNVNLTSGNIESSSVSNCKETQSAKKPLTNKVQLNIEDTVDTSTEFKCITLPQIKNLIERYIRYRGNKQTSTPIVKELQEVPVYKLVNFVILYLERDNGELMQAIGTADPLLTEKQKIIFGLLMQMERGEKSYDYIAQTVCQVEKFLLFSRRRNPEVLENMSRFYTALCRMRQKKQKVRMFLADLLYFNPMHKFIIIYTIVTSWLNVLKPHKADDTGVKFEDVVAYITMAQTHQLTGSTDDDYDNCIGVMKNLLCGYYKFPKEIADIDDLIMSLLEAYMCSGDIQIEVPILILCGNATSEWTFEKVQLIGELCKVGTDKVIVHNLFKLIVKIGKKLINRKDELHKYLANLYAHLSQATTSMNVEELGTLCTT